MSADQIARRHFGAALAEAAAQGQDPDATARCLLNLVLESYLARRSVADVRSELLFLADNCDPDTDFMFMRP
ncbi:MAG: hypothetical protein ISS15_15510 [Alphaproteobacteria bacterium]|nr:hypothetical protein [Alphaproteobacteria bacterium]MBL6937728.1 hypothetical protein [Alphaproteobacteria bacterium]MBL7099066.1 hypothetical protein [Alphaproteobacteria bacterium]